MIIPYSGVFVPLLYWVVFDIMGDMPRIPIAVYMAGIAACVCMAPLGVSASDISDQIDDLNAHIQQLEQERAAYEAQARQAGVQAKTLANEVAKFNAQINQIGVQIRSLEAKIELTGIEIGGAEDQIAEAERQIAVHRDALGQFLQAYSEFDEQGAAEVLLSSKELSDFFDHLSTLERTQAELQGTISAIHELRDSLDDERDTLREQQKNLEHLKGLQELDERSLESKKSQKDVLLQQTQGQEAKFQSLAEQSQAKINSLRQQIQFLIQGGISVEDAVTAAKLAATGAGIRPAFLLALLEVESRLGQNVGTGNWQDDMVLCYRRLGDIWYPQRRDYYYQRAATEEAAFLKITGRLGIDPGTVKVSKEPTYGCGGAMGPAQFIPSTWLGYEAEVARLTGNNPPNPWNTRDAFTAAAIKLAQGGAASKDRAGETLAAKRYICGGNITQAICSSYASTVLNKAADIEQNL